MKRPPLLLLAAALLTCRADAAPAPFSVDVRGPSKIVTSKSRWTVQGRVGTKIDWLFFTKGREPWRTISFADGKRGGRWKFTLPLDPGRNTFYVTGHFNGNDGRHRYTTYSHVVVTREMPTPAPTPTPTPITLPSTPAN